MNEKQIQNELFRYCCFTKQHKYIIPNFHFNQECDLISVTRSGLIYEYEIKCSRSDFKNEFRNKKDKHNNLTQCLNDGKRFLKSGKRYYDITSSIPNYFWFACPEDLLELNDIPEHAGLIEIHRLTDKYQQHIEIIKQAPRLHREKITNETIKSIANSLVYRYWKTRI